ncbi:MAG: MerR family transcriptional regulator [Bacteroidales bacterium]
MSALNPKPEKLFYTIGEVAAMFDVNISLIRFWEKEFDIIRPKKNKKGNRLFTQTDIDNFHLLFHLIKERGYTLQGAKQKLSKNPDEQKAEMEILKSLQRVRKTLLDIRAEL